MAIEFFDGFEAGQLIEWTWPQANITTSPRSGTYSLRSSDNSAISLTLPATTKKTIGFAYYMNNTGIYGRSDYHLASFYASGTQHLTIRFDATGHIELRRGSSTGTVIATSTQVWSAVSGWAFVEMQATIDDSTGICKFRVDGVEWINFTGDTRNGGSSVSIDQFWAYHTASATSYMDDFYVLNETDATATTGRADNTFLGDIKVSALTPNGNGATSQWVGSDGNSTDNYALVDEVPPNTTDYTGSSTNSDRDLWTVSDIPTSTIAVYALQPHIYASKSDAGAASMKIIHRDNAGTVVAGSTQAVSTSWLWYRGSILTTKPSGGAWTVAEVNALQIGVERA